jgi:hypothetical protein
LPWLTELAANFGRLGIVIGMAVIGIVWAAIDQVFNSHGVKDLALIVGLSVIFPFVYPESNVSVMVGSSIQQLIFFVAYFIMAAFVTDAAGRRIKFGCH